MNMAANSQEIGPPLWVSAATEHQAIHALSQVGISRDAAVGIWVALKSKPAIVLCGPDGSGKKTFALSVAKTIVGDTDWQLLQFQGHPWWATNGKNPGLFTRAQQRLNTYRLRAFLDEAVTAQTSANLFFAVFHKISRAELSSFGCLCPPTFLPEGSSDFHLIWRMKRRSCLGTSIFSPRSIPVCSGAIPKGTEMYAYYST